jgi:hypothetical protein
MDKDTVYLLGCSFTEAIKHFNSDFFIKFRDNYNIINLAYASRSNFQILEDIKSLPNNSIAVIQWSALTRPSGIHNYDIDWNIELNNATQLSSDPLKFLINNFINVVNKANKILKSKNIKTFQYIGWVQWANNELDKTLISLLKELPIHWFFTPDLIDVMPSGCWEYNANSFVLPIKSMLGGRPTKWEWKSSNWGGMSEWIRLNITDMYNRWAALYEVNGYNDAHPTEYASEQFYKSVVLIQIEKMLQNN